AVDPELQLRLADGVPVGTGEEEVPSGDAPGGGGPLRQLGVQPVQPRPEGDGARRAADPPGDDERLRVLRRCRREAGAGDRWQDGAREAEAAVSLVRGGVRYAPWGTWRAASKARGSATPKLSTVVRA